MELDDQICLCFHVTKRKLINFVRIEKPKRPSQLSNCFGAGTGCGWCRPFLEKIFEETSQRKVSEQESEQGAAPPNEAWETDSLPAAEDYAAQRKSYVLAGKGKPPPGATPIG